MLWPKYILFLTAGIIAQFHSNSQTISTEKFKRCPVKTINFEQGLMNNETAGIVTDLNGFTWVSTRSGLQRYNGYSLDIINPVIGKDTIFINSPVYLFAQKKGDIWICYKKGVLSYNPSTNLFTKIISVPVTGSYFFPIAPLLETKEGVWCMQYGKGIVLYNENLKSSLQINVNDINELIKSNDLIQKSIIAANTKYIFIRVSENQLLKINTIDHSTQYINSYKNIIGIGCNEEKLFINTGQSLLAVGIQDENLRKTFSLAKILKEPINFSCIQPESNGKLIICLNGHIYEIDSSLTFWNELSTLDEDPVVPSGNIHHIYSDSFARLWILTDNDIRIIQNINIPFVHFTYKNEKSDIVRCIYYDSITNTILAGSIDISKGRNGGIRLFDSTGKPLWFKPFFTNEVRNIQSIEKLKEGNFLIITSDQRGWYLLKLPQKQLEKINWPTDKKTQFQLNTTVWPNNLQRVNDSTILVCSSINIFRCVFKNKRVQSIKPVLPLNGSNSNVISCFIYTSEKNIWAGTYGGTLYRLQKDGSLQTFSVAGNYIIRCFAEDASHDIWVGTDKGITVFTSTGVLIKTIDTRSGLLNDFIYAMLPLDNTDAMFCSSKLGLSYVPLNGQIKNYTKELGLQENEFNTESAIKTSNGKFYFGGINGITAFYPSNLSELSDNPVLDIISLTVNDSLCNFASGIWRNDSISLNYKQNHLQFDVAALGLLNADEYEYKYRLRSFEEKWHTTRTPLGIKYVLQPGNYSLEITCTPIFSSQNITKKIIAITIAPPWWQTSSFRIIGVILSIAVIALLLQVYNRRKYQQKLRTLQVQQEIQHERERISRDLHDSLGAYAASIASNIDHINIPNSDLSSETAMEELRSNSRSIVSQLSDTIWALKKDALSLTAISDRIKVFIQKIQLSYPDVKMEISEQIDIDQILPSSQAFHLLQIIQEAINNSLRHSQCTLVTIYIEGKNEWKIIITDNGKGMPTEDLFTEKGNGLSNMVSRANEAGWKINWGKNHPTGTSVVIQPSTTN